MGDALMPNLPYMSHLRGDCAWLYMKIAQTHSLGACRLLSLGQFSFILVGQVPLSFICHTDKMQHDRATAARCGDVIYWGSSSFAY